MKFDGFWMVRYECRGIFHHQCQITASAGSGHFPGHDAFHLAVFVYVGLYAGFRTGLTIDRGGNHGWEKGYLGIEGGLIGGCKSL